MATNRKIQEVLDRARSNLNDSQGQLWTDARLLPKVANAYGWLYSQTAKYAADQLWKKIVGQPYSADLNYVANTVDITSILPVDLYLPEKLEYRLGTSDEWTEVERRVTLPSQMGATPGTPTNWSWFNRTLKMNPASGAALLRFTYLSLLASAPTDVGADILIDNAVEALAYYTAADAYASRGQAAQAKLMMGSDEGQPKQPASGALGFLGLMLDHLVLNQQLIARRGAPFSSGAIPTLGGTSRIAV